MTLKYNRLGYLIGEGFSNVFKNKKSTIASLVIMCATMIIFGISYAISENVNNFVSKMEADQGIQVFVDRNASEETIKKVGEEISKISGVSNVEFKSKEQALEQMKEMLEDKQELLAGYEDDNNFLPASYVVTFTDLSLNKQIQDEISKIENIESIQKNDPVSDALVNIAKGIKIVTTVILVLLIMISIFIISNTIKLTVHVRRREISIMRYVGATNNFIRWPFIVEGMIIGIFAGVISIGLIGVGYTGIANALSNIELIQKMNFNLMNFSEMFSSIVIVYLLLGIGIGTVGSIISMRKYLKV